MNSGPASKARSWLVDAMIVVASIGLLTVIAFPDFVRSYRASLFHAERDNLRQSVSVDSKRMLESKQLSNTGSPIAAGQVYPEHGDLCLGVSSLANSADTNCTSYRVSP
jgi:hypothetical protein